MAKIGLVLEGGGSRGIYTAGVLDVFLENDIAVDGVIGVSAGAIHGCSYVSKQIGRSIGYAMKYSRDPRYMSLRSLLKTGDYVGVEFCYHELPEKLYPFDNDTFEASPIDFYVTCTDVESGQAVYQKCPSVRGNDIDWVRASASLPLFSRIVEIEGQKLLDGGIADSIPLKAFEKLGFERNIVVLTRIAGYQKKPTSSMPLLRRSLKAYPKFLQTAQNRHNIYNQEVAYTEKEEREGNVCLIRPSEYLKVGRLERKPEKLQEMYELVRKDALAKLTEVKRFVEESKK